MSISPTVRDAYPAKSQQYIGLTVGGWPDDEEDTALVQRHLGGLPGPILDFGCGPGHWTSRLHSWGAEVTGVDLVPEFIAHARATHPETAFRLASIVELDVADSSTAGALSWYSTIHLPPDELDNVLVEFRRVLRPGGVLVIGFVDSDDHVADFDHKVMTAYQWRSTPSPSVCAPLTSSSSNAVNIKFPAGPTAGTPPSLSVPDEPI